SAGETHRHAWLGQIGSAGARPAHRDGARNGSRTDPRADRHASGGRRHLMDVSDVRRRVKEVIEHARRAVTERRTVVAEATRDYEQFLERVATPLFRQIGNVLRTEGHPYTVSTPAGSVRLSSDRSGQDYVELSLDTSGRQPQVVVHSSRSRGRRVIE